MNLPHTYVAANGREIILFDSRTAREPFTLFPRGPTSTRGADGTVTEHPGGLKRAPHMTRFEDSSGQGAHVDDPAYQAMWDRWERMVVYDVRGGPSSGIGRQVAYNGNMPVPGVNSELDAYLTFLGAPAGSEPAPQPEPGPEPPPPAPPDDANAVAAERARCRRILQDALARIG